MPEYLVVGCGLSGTVIAERIANKLNHKVTIIEKREHIGGNCYDYIDKETNILINKYGAHLFHTNNEYVWNYVNKFDKWIRWEHKVLTFTDNKFVSIPVNITTINELCEENLQNETDVNEWLEKNVIPLLKKYKLLKASFYIYVKNILLLILKTSYNNIIKILSVNCLPSKRCLGKY